MLKREEQADPQSCLNRAREDEFIFVLLARDVAAPATIRVWAMERVRLGKNKPDDPQILDALNAAAKMQQESATAPVDVKWQNATQDETLK